jgi:hypothetical protein
VLHLWHVEVAATVTAVTRIVPAARNGAWPNLVTPVCQCGWVGPLRNLHLPSDEVALDSDIAHHLTGCEVAS